MIGIDGLRQKVHRALLDRNHRVLKASIGRHHDDGKLGVDVLGALEHANTVAAHQPQIGQHEIRPRLAHQPQRLGLVYGFDDRVALLLERVPQHRAQGVLVFNEQNWSEGTGH